MAAIMRVYREEVNELKNASHKFEGEVRVLSREMQELVSNRDYLRKQLDASETARKRDAVSRVTEFDKLRNTRDSLQIELQEARALATWFAAERDHYRDPWVS